jgi:sulfur-carrier protein adenylyltransferase/sulfurtransferase
MNRYIRQTALPEVGAEGQAKLAAARVLVVGAGGLAAGLLPLLVGAGIGHLRLIDPDLVEESNLHRQTLFRMADLGRFKAEVAAEALRGLNPDCRISPLVARLDPVLAAKELKGCNLVVDAADSVAVTYGLSDLCLRAGLPLISASVLGRSGYIGGFCGGAPSYRALFPDLPAVMPSCNGGGVMGPVVAMLGALQAQMVLSVLLDHAPSALGQMLSVDLASWRVSSFRFDAAEEPAQAQPEVIGLAQIAPEDLVIELRDLAEAPALPVPQALRLDAAALAAFTPEPGRRLVFVCATGLRAWRAARRFEAARVAIMALP